MTPLTARCSKCWGEGWLGIRPSGSECYACGGKGEVQLPTYRTATLGSLYVARARKDHPCSMCDWTIPAGDHHWTWSLPPFMGDGDYWYVGRAHAICEELYSASDWPLDEPLPDPLDFRYEFLDRAVSVERGHVEWSA